MEGIAGKLASREKHDTNLQVAGLFQKSWHELARQLSYFKKPDTNLQEAELFQKNTNTNLQGSWLFPENLATNAQGSWVPAKGSQVPAKSRGQTRSRKIGVFKRVGRGSGAEKPRQITRFYVNLRKCRAELHQERRRTVSPSTPAKILTTINSSNARMRWRGLHHHRQQQKDFPEKIGETLIVNPREFLALPLDPASGTYNARNYSVPWIHADSRSMFPQSFRGSLFLLLPVMM